MSKFNAFAILSSGAVALALSVAATPADARGNGNGHSNAGGNGNSGANNGNGGQAPFSLTATPTVCALSDIGPAASACLGWYSGNLNNGSPTDLASVATALNSLLGVNTYTAANSGGIDNFVGSGGEIDFGQALYGDTVISVHVGGANGAPTGVGYQATAFFRFDAGNLPGGLQEIAFNRAGLSNARLFYTSQYTPTAVVPEPAAWGMMILGFFGAGSVIRRRRAVTA